jgi:hypothetical protein
MLGTKTWCTHGRPGRPCVHQSIMIPCITGRVGMLGTKTWCPILGAFRKPVGVKPWLGHPKYIKIKCQVVRIFGLLKNAQNRG